MIQPGLERIGQLLKNVDFPWKAIHVAGTNGKGSVCAYAHAMLTRRTIPTGRFTSPHIIDRWDCIHINNSPVEEARFKKVESHFVRLNDAENIGASEFELLTATAFQLFTDHRVEFGVVEVGMGGRLDATNILNNQVVSVIAKIAHDHQNFLGNNLDEIARHKAGILRPNVPYIVNSANEWMVKQTIQAVAEEIGAGPLLTSDHLQDVLFGTQDWVKFSKELGPAQKDNAIMAFLAVQQALGADPIKLRKLLPGIKNHKIKGRFESTTCKPVFGIASNEKILVDGAHNEDAARALANYVASTGIRRIKGRPGNRSITWVIAMSDGKDIRKFLPLLVRSGDRLVITTFGPVDGMPWVKPMDPVRILEIAEETIPDIVAMVIPERGALRALMAAKYLTENGDQIVLTGSLYLCGDFFREKEAWEKHRVDLDLRLMERQERNRVNHFLSLRSSEARENDASTQESKLSEEQEKQRLQKEIDELEAQLKLLDKEAVNIAESTSPDLENIPGYMDVGIIDSRLAMRGVRVAPGEEDPRVTIRKHFSFSGQESLHLQSGSPKERFPEEQSSKERTPSKERVSSSRERVSSSEERVSEEKSSKERTPSSKERISSSTERVSSSRERVSSSEERVSEEQPSWDSEGASPPRFRIRAHYAGTSQHGKTHGKTHNNTPWTKHTHNKK